MLRSTNKQHDDWDNELFWRYTGSMTVAVMVPQALCYKLFQRYRLVMQRAYKYLGTADGMRLPIAQPRYKIPIKEQYDRDQQVHWNAINKVLTMSNQTFTNSINAQHFQHKLVENFSSSACTISTKYSQHRLQG